jgi:membrane-associated phospholipid phosphatase
VYVGHHWPSDVLGGFVLGALLLALLIALDRLVFAPRASVTYRHPVRS